MTRMTRTGGPGLPDDVMRFAGTVVGSFRERYDQILARGFSEHALIPNAKQLRELAGGGSQSTAQQAIDEFRASLRDRLSFKLPIGEDVPAEVADAAAKAAMANWAFASSAARAQFEEDRKAVEEQVRAAAVERGVLEASLADLTAQLAAARHAFADRQRALDEVSSKLVATGREKVEIQAQLDLEIAEKQRSLALIADLESRLRAAQGLATAAAAQAAERFDRMLREHREAMGVASREHADEISRLSKDRDGAARERDAARSERATADIERARAEQRAAGLQEQVAALQREAEDLRGALAAQGQSAAQARLDAAAEKARADALQWSIQNVPEAKSAAAQSGPASASSGKKRSAADAKG